MAIIIGLLFSFGVSYLMYLYSQKTGAKNSILAAINLIVPLIGIIYGINLLIKKLRGKLPGTNNIKGSYIPPGFRSKKAWKMVLATTAYLFLGVWVAAASTATVSPSTNNSTVKPISIIGTAETAAKEAITGSGQENKSATADLNNTASAAAAPLAAPNGKLNVSFINVGQGDCELIQTPKGQTVLIDGGKNEATATVENYLRSLGIKELDYIIATHEDADHIGSLDAVVRDFEVGKVYMPKLPEDKTTNTFHDFALAVKAKGLKFDQAKAGISLDLGNNIGATFVGPVKAIYKEDNDYSAVLRLTYGSTSYLFTGDAESASENDMIASGQDLKSTVLKVGHHGSQFSTSDAFLNKVGPKYAVISVGQNSYGHPTAEVLSRLSQHGVQVYRTDQSGTVVATSDGSNVTFSTNVVGPNSSSSSETTQQPASPPSTTISTPVTTPTTVPIQVRTPVPEPAPAPTPSKANLNVAAQISNPAPTGGREVVTATVTDSGKPVQGADVTLTVHYKSTTKTVTGTTDANGVTRITWSIGNPSKGYSVSVDVAANYGGNSASTQVSFTPH